MKNLLVLTLLFVIICASAAAQVADSINPFNSSLKGIGKTYGDSVVLRWAPERPAAWITYNDAGYIVDRKRIDGPSSSTKQGFERLTPAPLVPWTKNQWFANSTKSNTFAGVAAQCLYGTLAVPSPQGNDALRMAATDLKNRHSFALLAADLNTVAANGLAMRFVDRNVQSGAEYVYRIYPARMDSLYKVDTAIVYVNMADRMQRPSPRGLLASGSESSVRLQWEARQGESVSGYYIDRTDPSGKTVRLTATPYVPVATAATAMTSTPAFDDTTAAMYVPYIYAVHAIDAFADTSAAATVSGMARDATPPPVPSVHAPTVFGSTIARLEWLPMKPGVPDLAGYRVERSASPEGPFLPLTTTYLDATAEGYVDTAATQDEPWYIVSVIDTAGNVASTLPYYVELVDTLPPAAPEQLSGFADTTGLVFLAWRMGAEKDLYGYRVLWANDSTHVFTQLTNLIIRDTFYLDSIALNTGTKHVYYKVVAVDTRHIHSAPSPMLTIRRPDILPPESPVISNVLVTDTTVVIDFIASTSGDVATHIVERSVASQPDWKGIDTLGAQANIYVDTTVRQRTSYLYRIVAVDSSSLRSRPSEAASATPYDAGRREPVTGVRARYDSASGKAIVTWVASSRPTEKFWYGIYRAVDDLGLRLYRSIKPSETSFTDGALVGSGRYKYAVRVMSAIAESPLSEECELVVP